MSTPGEHAERCECKLRFFVALACLLVCVLAAWMLARTESTGFLVDYTVFFVSLGAPFSAAQVIWFGSALLVLTTAPAWRSAMEAGITLVLWCATLLYFAQPPSSPTSIVERSDLWNLWLLPVAAFLGLCAYFAELAYWAQPIPPGRCRVPVRRFIVAIGILATICYMTRFDVRASTDEDGYYIQDVDLSPKDSAERAYFNYVVYSAFIGGGTALAMSKRQRSSADRSRMQPP